MRSLNLHLKVLITLLVTLGVLITAYQIFILGIPVTEDETDDLWNIDAKVEFQATPRDDAPRCVRKPSTSNTAAIGAKTDAMRYRKSR